MQSKLTGLIAATVTPLDPAGEVNLAAIGPYVEFLIKNRVDGLFVCGTTGEGISLSTQERMAATSEFIKAADGRIPVIVHVGHNSLTEAQSLAKHAQSQQATATSATSPSFFKPNDASCLADCMQLIASAAADLPFYYYNIPSMTGVRVDMVDFLQKASERIPNLVGLKYTDPTLQEFQACSNLDDGRFDVLWGVDEMLLPALAVGAEGAVGSTYNIAAPLYQALIHAFEQGNLEEGRALQSKSIQMVRTMLSGPFLPNMKRVLHAHGQDCGQCRLPLPSVSENGATELCELLKSIGYFDWSGIQR